VRLASRIADAARKNPLSLGLGIIALASALYVLGAPFFAARYAPMTDVPFHAAQTGALRHYFDPSYHIQEQFELHPLAVPYMSSYVIGALAMFAFPPWIAVKIAAFVMLALLPVGLSVMFSGMKKSPLLGLLGLPFAWTHLTHWGFLNFVGAIGLFAMTIGFTLRLLDRPSTPRQVALSSTLVLLFFTHVFRFPFAALSVLGTALVMYPATRRFRPIVLPLLPPLALFWAWTRVRPATIGEGIALSLPAKDRLHELLPLLLEGGFNDLAEANALRLAFKAVVFVGLFCALAFVLENRLEDKSRRAWAWGMGVTLVALGSAGAFLLLFLMLPMQSGTWWYVYPREAVATAFVALGVVPDLPRTRLLKAPLVLALALAPLALGRAITANYRAFDRATEDFHQITRNIPLAPKLLYLVFDHGGSTKKNTPFIHLPAYVQAEKGGWLSFHFAMFGASPLEYRPKGAPGALIPPPVPLRWEWTPERFRVREHGPFFDWFLVRSRNSPMYLFAADPTITAVDHVGTWWLYRRRPTTN